MQQERPVDITKILQEIQGPSNEEKTFRKENLEKADEKYFDEQNKKKYPAISSLTEGVVSKKKKKK